MSQQSPQTGGASAGGTGNGLTPNVASMLCYVCTPITAIIFLAIEKENQDVKFHAWQGLFFGVAAIILEIGVSILAALFSAIAGFLAIIISVLLPLIYIGILIIWVICMIKAYQGERYKLPFIGDLAEKQLQQN